MDYGKDGGIVTNIVNCAYCGAQGKWRTIDQERNRICDNCLALFGTCAMCTEAQKCDFETNPINLPKQVQKTIRQGNMIMQTVINNPDRIAKTCQENCSCFDPDFGCMKQNGTCAKYQEKEPIFNSPSEEEFHNE